jgi:hypothetical protein
MNTKISFTISPNVKKYFDQLGHFSNINTYATKAFIARVSHDLHEKKKRESEKINAKKARMREPIVEKYPSWLQIDTYDDMGARSSKRKAQEKWDRNPKCTVCEIDMQHHCDKYGNTNQDHFFSEEEK